MQKKRHKKFTPEGRALDIVKRGTKGRIMQGDLEQGRILLQFQLLKNIQIFKRSWKKKIF